MKATRDPIRYTPTYTPRPSHLPSDDFHDGGEDGSRTLRLEGRKGFLHVLVNRRYCHQLISVSTYFSPAKKEWTHVMGWTAINPYMGPRDEHPADLMGYFSTGKRDGLAKREEDPIRLDEALIRMFDTIGSSGVNARQDVCAFIRTGGKVTPTVY